MNRRVSRVRFSRAPRIFTLFFTLSLTLALFAPMNFVIITPGTPSPLFPKTLALTGVESYPARGQLYLLTILVTNPDTRVYGAAIAGCWIWGDCVVVPRSAIYDRDSTNEVEKKAGTQAMEKSQSVAVAAARSQIAQRFPEVDPTSVVDSAVEVSLKNTGGPSGGLIFALGLVELFTPTDILQGRKVAGSGTITADGEVGPIGGVVEKIVGAKKSGVELLFIAKANCVDLPSKVEGIKVVAVATLDEAVAYLVSDSQEKGPLNSAGVRGCASVSA